MAKRFTDTALGRKKWFRVLSPAMKCAWRFLCDECDRAGVWSIDEDALSFYVGESFPLKAFIDACNSDGETRIIRIEKDKLLLVGFVPFQYGTLSEDCKPHREPISRLKALNLWDSDSKGIRYPLETLQEKEKETEKEKEKEKEGGVGGTNPDRKTIAALVTSEDVRECLDEWKTTLDHFGKVRPLGMPDEIGIAAAVRRFGPEWVKLALQGARMQKSGPRFDPKQFVSLAIYLHPTRIERLVNIGCGKESAEGTDWASIFSKEQAS